MRARFGGRGGRSKEWFAAGDLASHHRGTRQTVEKGKGKAGENEREGSEVGGKKRSLADGMNREEEGEREGCVADGLWRRSEEQRMMHGTA